MSGDLPQVFNNIVSESNPIRGRRPRDHHAEYKRNKSPFFRKATIIGGSITTLYALVATITCLMAPLVLEYFYA